MEGLSVIAKIYACAAGAAAGLWIMCDRYGCNPQRRCEGIAVWFLVKFAVLYSGNLTITVRTLACILTDILFAWRFLHGEMHHKIKAATVLNIVRIFADWLVIELLFLLCDERSALLIAHGVNEMPRIMSRIFTGSIYFWAVYMYIRQRKQMKRKREQLLLEGVLGGGLLFAVLLLCEFIDYASIPLPWRCQAIFWGLVFAALTAFLYLVGYLGKQEYYAAENAALKAQLLWQQQLAGEQSDYQRVRMLRHDMKRYFVTYLQLLQDGEEEIVEDDMRRVLAEEMAERQHRYTADAVINAVINEKAERCRKCGIVFTINIVWKEGSDDFKLGMMLSNLLDNAIEAEQNVPESLRRIFLTIRAEGVMLHIIVANFIGASVLERNPRLATTKQNAKEAHGIGITIVKRFVAEREGEMEIFEKNNSFTVHICIPM